VIHIESGYTTKVVESRTVATPARLAAGADPCTQCPFHSSAKSRGRYFALGLPEGEGPFVSARMIKLDAAARNRNRQRTTKSGLNTQLAFGSAECYRSRRSGFGGIPFFVRVRLLGSAQKRYPDESALAINGYQHREATEKSTRGGDVRTFIVIACAACAVLALSVSRSFAQSDPTGTPICDLPGYRGTAIYNQYCGSAPSAPAISGGGLTTEQQMGAQLGGLALGMIVQGLQESSQQEAARQAAAAAARAAEAERNRAIEEQRQAELRRLQEEAFQHSKGDLLDTLQGPDGSTGVADNVASNKVGVISPGGYNFHQSQHFTTGQPSQAPRLSDQLLGPDDSTTPPAPADQSTSLASQMMGPDGGAPAVNEIGMTQGQSIGGAGVTSANGGAHGSVGNFSKGDIVPDLNGSDEAASAAAQKPFDSAGAAPAVSIQASQTSLSGTDVAGNRVVTQNLGVPSVQLTAATLAKVAPLLRQPESGGPIAAGRPAICEPLSRQLDETYQIARRAVLASDIYDRYKSKDVPLPVIPGFDRISDRTNNEQITEMRKLLPSMSGESIRHLLQADDSDYRAAIYEEYVSISDQKHNYSRNIFLVFRGTVPTSRSDWMKGNVAQAACVGSDYYTSAIVLAHNLKQSAAANGYQLEIVGHSLGGVVQSKRSLPKYSSGRRHVHRVPIPHRLCGRWRAIKLAPRSSDLH
jgi:hypothetical protein